MLCVLIAALFTRNSRHDTPERRGKSGRKMEKRRNTQIFASIQYHWFDFTSNFLCVQFFPISIFIQTHRLANIVCFIFSILIAPMVFCVYMQTCRFFFITIVAIVEWMAMLQNALRMKFRALHVRIEEAEKREPKTGQNSIMERDEELT